MDWLHIIILGIVEGVTEFLPISSTGHMILTARVLAIPPGDFLSSFEIGIQLGAILAVVVLYARRFFANPARLTARILTAFLPTAALGFLLYSLIKNYLFDNYNVVLAALFLGGIFLIVFEYFYREKDNATEDLGLISYKNCFLIGIFQALAVVPGVSRAAATIVGGLVLGLKRKTIVEFSFLLAVPTMLGATALDLWQTGAVFTPKEWWQLAAGALVAFLVAMLAIKFFLGYVQKRNFSGFGWYRVALAALFWFFIIR